MKLPALVARNVGKVAQAQRRGGGEELYFGYPQPYRRINNMAQFLITILVDIGRMERATLVERVK